MTKQLFIETIKQIKKQTEYDNILVSNLSKIFPDAFEGNLLPKNYFLRNQLIKILQIETKDDQTEHSWIEYFIDELYFGQNYKNGCASRADESNIDLSTSSKLYDFLKE